MGQKRHGCKSRRMDGTTATTSTARDKKKTDIDSLLYHCTVDKELSLYWYIVLVDQAINSIQTDDANMAIQGNVAMQVTQYGGQLWNQCKLLHLMTPFQANACGAIWWPNCQLMHLALANGQVCNWCHRVAKFLIKRWYHHLMAKLTCNQFK